MLRPEHVRRAGELIGAYRLALQRGQIFGSLAEVDRPGRDHHPDRAGRPDHAPLFKASITTAIAAADAAMATRPY